MSSPRLAARAAHLRESVFARLARKMKAIDAPITPLHIGDTWINPPAAAQLGGIAIDPLPSANPYAYVHPAGLPALREALADRARERLGVSAASSAWVTVCAGATQSLNAVATALFDPGDGVLILAPHWPLIPGVLRGLGITPVVVPAYDRFDDESALLALISEAIRDARDAKLKVRGLYFNTPNNPTGRILDRPTLEALLTLAQEEDLWLLSDEAYADYAFGSRRHLTPLALPGAEARCVAVYTFSKSHALAGYRVGWTLASPEVSAAISRASTHQTYCAPVAGQLAALGAMGADSPWQRDACTAYEAAAEEASRLIPLPHQRAEGGSFLFFDADALLPPDAPDVMPLLMRILEEAHVTLSPGIAFGEAYQRWFRLCYTSVPPETLRAACARVASVL